MNFKIIDAGIMNGFETLTRLGGYIMLFSMIASMLQALPTSRMVRLIAIGLTELTNGIQLLDGAPASGYRSLTEKILSSKGAVCPLLRPPRMGCYPVDSDLIVAINRADQM